jgi:hypothetical protein
MLYLIAGLTTFAFTVVLTVAGLGAAFILIPVFIALGVEVHIAMATALLLNSVAMAIASADYIRHKLVVFKSAIPIAIVAVVLSPLGAYLSHFTPRDTLLWLFTGFLIFAGSMMLFYKPRPRVVEGDTQRTIRYGVAVGGFAGFFGGLIGVGGGNFIVPVLVWLGFDPKKASATTAFVVVFASLAGFLGHFGTGHIETKLLLVTVSASVLGAIFGARLMTARLKSHQVKTVIGVILYIVALQMIWKLMV